jgi:DNA-binding transcriptional ArsR family regulator
LVNHRAQRLDGHGDSFRIAWLPEDPYRITDVESFLAQVAKHAKPVGSTAPLTVVLVENLDQVFSRLGPVGQATLRSRLEQRRDLLLLATSPRLTKAVLDHSEPFFGFFATTALEPFTVAEATAMLQKLALANGEPELADRLEGAPTQARLAAIRQLAGGQPRIWAVLASGLTVGTLDDLLSALVREFDNLTPYYQERLGQLSPNQLKVVLALVDAEGSLSVKDIAHATGVKQGSASVALKELAGAGWVRARTGTLVARETQPSISQVGAPSGDLNGLAGRSDRRNVYYDLAEPLVRVALQLKESEGRPVPLILEFLASFFSVEESAQTARRQAEKTDLKRHTESALPQAGGSSHRLREEAFAAWAANPFAADGPCDPALAAWYERLDDALAEFESTGRADRLLHLPASLADLVEQRLADRSPAFLRLQLALALSRAESSLGRALDALPGVTEREAAAARWIVACLRAAAGQTEAAWATLAELMEGPPTALGAPHHDTVITAAKQASPLLGPWKTAALAGWLAQARGQPEDEHWLTLWLLGPASASPDEAAALPPQGDSANPKPALLDSQLDVIVASPNVGRHPRDFIGDVGVLRGA